MGDPIFWLTLNIILTQIVLVEEDYRLPHTVVLTVGFGVIFSFFIL